MYVMLTAQRLIFSSDESVEYSMTETKVATMYACTGGVQSEETGFKQRIS